MLASAPVLRIPATARMSAAGFGYAFKPPRLGEAYEYFTRQPMINAHNAMVDVQACMAVYFGLIDSAKGQA